MRNWFQLILVNRTMGLLVIKKTENRNKIVANPIYVLTQLSL